MENSLTQYIELYHAQRQAIEAASPAVLNALREKALNVLEATRLPRKGQEDYEATDMNAIFAPDYGVNVNRFDLARNFTPTFSCDLPNLGTTPVYMLGDTIVVPGKELADGVVVTSFAQAAKTCPELLERHYGTVARLDNAATALNTLLAQDGLLVYVPRGVKARPLQLINIFNANAPLMAVRRILLIAEEHAQVQMLVCDHTQNETQRYLSNQVVEIIAREGASVDYYDMEESTPLTSRVSALYVKQEGGSNVLVDGITLDCGTTRNDYHFDVAGERAESHLLGMAIASGTQHIDNHTFIDHSAPRCTSREMFKYILGDNAVGAFAGKILVRPGCPGTDAYQGNRNLVTSASAKMYTKPQLEIYTDDVQCSHGSTIGQLDEDALFYMRSRGVSEETARTLLMQAFMADVIDGVRIDTLKERLYHLVERRLAGDDATCDNCPIRK